MTSTILVAAKAATRSLLSISGPVMGNEVLSRTLLRLFSPRPYSCAARGCGSSRRLFFHHIVAQNKTRSLKWSTRGCHRGFMCCIIPKIMEVGEKICLERPLTFKFSFTFFLVFFSRKLPLRNPGAPGIYRQVFIGSSSLNSVLYLIAKKWL